MRILILNSFYYPNMIGGAEHSVKLLAENLLISGYDVYVLSMDGDDDSDITKAEEINGVLVYRSYSKELYRRRIEKKSKRLTDKVLNGVHSICNIKFNKDVKRVIDAVEPDIVHTQNLVSMSYYVWKYAAQKGIPIIHTLRDYWLLDPTTNLDQYPQYITIPFRMYHRYLSNKYVTAVTSPSAKTLDIFEDERYFAHSIKRVVVNSIEFDHDLLEHCLAEKAGRKSEMVRFLFVGNVSENKGIRLLIESFEKVVGNVTLSVCGDGELIDWVRNRKDGRVACLGKLDQKNLANEYRKADVLIVPSKWEEPFGRIVIEGAQYGLPVIGSNKGGIPEIINTIEYGDIFNSGDESELVRLIRKYADRSYLSEIYANGPKRLEKYAMDRQVEDFSHIYIKIKKGN